MASIRLIKPDRQYAGLSQGWWLKNYWQYVYPRILSAERERELHAPDEGQSGPVMYAVGKYAHAFAEPELVVKLAERDVERYHMTHTIRRGFVIPFVKFIALESDGDGSSFDELRNVAQSLALDSDVDITFKVTGGTIIEDGKEIDSTQRIDIRNAMDYYCESHPIYLPPPAYGQQGNNTRTNRAISSSFMAIFEPQEEGTYRIDVTSRYLFRFRGRSKDYGPLEDHYEIVVALPIEKTPGYRQGP
jgi:hypothetical protein